MLLVAPRERDGQPGRPVRGGAGGEDPTVGTGGGPPAGVRRGRQAADLRGDHQLQSGGARGC